MCGFSTTRTTTAFVMEPYTANCREICGRADHVLVGVSPGNGYFTEQRLTDLLTWAGSVFADVEAIVPDASLVHTYQALGSDEASAWKEARRQSRRTCRRISRAWAAGGVPERRQRIHLLSDFIDHPGYRRLRAEVDAALAQEPVFRQALFEATGRALSTRLHGAEPSLAQIEEGVRYLTSEVPLCMDAPGILGVPTSVNIYHQVLPTVPVMLGSQYLRVSPQQGFAVVRPAAETVGVL
ncbi:cyclo(L-leucyl-L-leucyl) synthase [Nonomuraea longicatena]|uniref:Cyclodipeptide synthase n=2 Tax=Nonomuraea longicatena TaxID=83682 RepID=A0ABN1R3Q2_9ACTN